MHERGYRNRTMVPNEPFVLNSELFTQIPEMLAPPLFVPGDTAWKI